MHTITLSGLYPASRHCLPAVLPGLEGQPADLEDGGVEIGGGDELVFGGAGVALRELACSGTEP